jgi:hypothetical protein
MRVIITSQPTLKDFTLFKHRLPAFIATVTLILTLAPTTAMASTTGASDGFTYSDDGVNVTITGCDGPCSGSLEIPSTLSATGDHPVLAIADNAFNGNFSLTSVSIGDGVETIGVSAFESAFSLTSVAVPSSLITISDRAFYDNRELASFVFIGGSSLVTIGAQAFQSTKMNNFTIPATVQSVGDCVFASAGELTYIDVALGNTYLKSEDGILLSANGEELISYPIARPNAFIPDSVVNIHTCAFYGNGFVSSLTFGPKVSSIGVVAFAGNDLLTDATFFGNLPTGGQGFLYSLPDGATVRYFKSAAGWNELVASGDYSNVNFVAMPSNDYIRPAAIAGKLIVGKVVKIKPGSWKTTFSKTIRYQFYICKKAGATVVNMTKAPKGCWKIKNATSSTLTIKKAHRGKYIRALVTVTALNGRANVFVKTNRKVK